MPLQSEAQAERDAFHDKVLSGRPEDRFAAERSVEWHRLNNLACDAQREANHWGWIARELIAQRDAQLAKLDRENSLNLPYTDEQRAVIRRACAAVKEALQPLIGAAIQGQRKKEAEAVKYRELKNKVVP